MPPYGQPYGQPAQSDAIALTLKWFPLSFIFAFLKPVVAIDGHRIEVPWNRRTLIPVAPGPHHVHVHVPYFLPSEVGRADIQVQVGGGYPAELEYRTPAHVFTGGALGPPPQKYPGMLVMWLLMGIPFALLLVMLICCCGSSLMGGSAGSSY